MIYRCLSTNWRAIASRANHRQMSSFGKMTSVLRDKVAQTLLLVARDTFARQIEGMTSVFD